MFASGCKYVGNWNGLILSYGIEQGVFQFLVLRVLAERLAGSVIGSILCLIYVNNLMEGTS